MLASCFFDFPFGLEVIDVTFQQANGPSDSIQEGKLDFSGKHKLYGLKVEVFVRPDLTASAFSSHYPNSVSDLTILYEDLTGHHERLERVQGDDQFGDNFLLAEEFPDSWAVLVDRGYQGASESLRAIIPRNESLRGILS